MSHTAAPISPGAFAEALKDLPVDSLHAKAAELQNSISHMVKSNKEMQEFADAGDRDCVEAISENMQTMQRMNERIELLKAEVEGRGLPWSHSTTGQPQRQVNGINPQVNGGSATTNGNGSAGSEQSQGGRLTDEQLRRQLAERMELDENEDGDGVYL